VRSVILSTPHPGPSPARGEGVRQAVGTGNHLCNGFRSAAGMLNQPLSHNADRPVTTPALAFPSPRTQARADGEDRRGVGPTNFAEARSIGQEFILFSCRLLNASYIPEYFRLAGQTLGTIAFRSADARRPYSVDTGWTNSASTQCRRYAVPVRFSAEHCSPSRTVCPLSWPVACKLCWTHREPAGGERIRLRHTSCALQRAI
jgi:hypothetical protein